MLKIKPGVKLCGLKPEMVLAIAIVNNVWEQEAVSHDCMVTSVTDGKHSQGSLHYIGCAVDFRVRDLADWQREEMTRKCREALGDEFDVVLNMKAPCLHVEWQPK